jgi:hypothetical protein
MQFRIPAVLHSAMDSYIMEHNSQPKQKKHTRTSFIRQAIREKLSHLERSKKSRKKDEEAQFTEDVVAEISPEVESVEQMLARAIESHIRDSEGKFAL